MNYQLWWVGGRFSEDFILSECCYLSCFASESSQY